MWYWENDELMKHNGRHKRDLKMDYSAALARKLWKRGRIRHGELEWLSKKIMGDRIPYYCSCGMT